MNAAAVWLPEFHRHMMGAHARSLTMLLSLGLALPACDDKKELPAHKGKSHSTQDAAASASAEPATDPKPVAGLSVAALLERARPLLPVLPSVADNPANPITDAKVELGRMLYFDKRLSKSQQISCNTCHDLAAYGIDVREKDGARMQTSEGHGGHFGGRNSPTVYNAGFHLAQFWDGRALDLEDQTTKAINDEPAMLATLKSIPGYAEPFTAAFPGGGDPITPANVSQAIAAFERKLVTPAPIDKFLAGDVTALDEEQLRGLTLFLDVGCTTCHTGPAIGGMQFQKLGSVKPWPDLTDEGRAAHTKSPLDRFVFKVPSLRNVAKTGPWLHDGSINDLSVMVQKMAEHQSARGKLTGVETAALVAFLGSLTGTLPVALISEPTLPPSGPQTPQPQQG